MSRWCETVGPIFFQPRPAAAATEPIDRVAIVSWNVHEGGGDVDELIRMLRRGELTGGEAVSHFVLLLQEATRRDRAVPARVPRGYPVPRAIAPRRGLRDADIRRFADAGYAVLYAPSMRNGLARTPDSAEDRGNAIVSPLPLADPRVIELPLERQRRVVAAAAIDGRTTSGVPWRLDLVNVHLDTALALLHGGPFAARRRQAAALIDALRLPERETNGGGPTVLAGDLNTWRGDGEAAVRLLARAFPDTPAAARVSTWRGPLGVHAALDHIFVRGAVAASPVIRAPDRLGSDHFPLLTVLRFQRKS